MTDVPVEVKKTVPIQTNVPDVWHSFRSEMDRLFDRFGFPSLRRVFDMEPSWRPASSFSSSAPAIDMSEDDKAYKISAELPGLDAKDVDVSISGNTLVLEGEKRQEKEEKEKELLFLGARLRLVPTRFRIAWQYYMGRAYGFFAIGAGRRVR
jgi:HSP20 family protein